MFSREDIELTGLSAIENLRLWASYMPECYLHNINNSKYRNFIINDRMLVSKIDNLYNIIKDIYGVFPNIENANNLNTMINKSNNNKLKKLIYDISREYGLIKYISSDKYNYSYIESLYYKIGYYIPKYASYKLSKEELNYCNNLLNKCNEYNIEEIIEEIESIDNFFVRGYAKYLLIYDTNSKYYNSIKCSSSRECNKLLNIVKIRN